jgi:hypothetical protein
MNSCKLKEIIVVEDFEVENGVLKLERDIYLSIVKFLDSSSPFIAIISLLPKPKFPAFGFFQSH